MPTHEILTIINPARITWCCEKYGVTLSDLSAATKIRLQKLETGQLTITQLEKVAKYFYRGISFFYGDDVPTEEFFSPQFRAIANESIEINREVKIMIERVESHREIYLYMLEEIDEPIQEFSPPAIENKNIEDFAARIREWLGLELEDENDFHSYREAVEAKGILVFLSNRYHGEWKVPKETPLLGFFLNYEQCPAIFVTKTAPARQVFTLMHELGHLLLKHKSMIDWGEEFDYSRKNEIEANKFAGNLLFPDSMLNQIDTSDLPHNHDDIKEYLSEHTKKCGISVEVILRQLLDKGRITKDVYEEYREWKKENSQPIKGLGNRIYRHLEPLYIFGEHYVGSVLEAMGTNRITLNKASSYLDHIGIDRMHKLREYILRKRQIPIMRKAVIDTSSLLYALGVYPIKRFSKVWKWLDGLIGSGRILILTVVKNEIKPNKSPDLHNWISKYTEHKMTPEIKDKATEIEGTLGIIKGAYDKGKGVGKNDIRIIAFAAINNLDVINNENPQRQKPKDKRGYKIPLVCEEENIRSYDFLTLVDESGKVF